MRVGQPHGLPNVYLSNEERYKAMHYTKPTIVTAERAILTIQQMNRTGSIGKILGSFLEVDFIACTPSAYEADE